MIGGSTNDFYLNSTELDQNTTLPNENYGKKTPKTLQLKFNLNTKFSQDYKAISQAISFSMLKNHAELPK